MTGCESCTDKCCKVGTGPWRAIPFEMWIGDQQEGTMCANWDEASGLCSIWDNKPLICSVSLCDKKDFDYNDLLSKFVELYNDYINLRYRHQ